VLLFSGIKRFPAEDRSYDLQALEQLTGKKFVRRKFRNFNYFNL
jgi:hypothetical protein